MIDEYMQTWDCNYCGSFNKMTMTHCHNCSTPSEEFMEEEKERKRQKADRRSVSVEREKKQEEADQRKVMYLKYMNGDDRDRPCMPQRLGETRNKQDKYIEGALARHRETLKDTQDAGPVPMFRDNSPTPKGKNAENERRQWDSDDEAYDEFGRRKRSKKSQTNSQEDSSRASGS